MPKFNVEVSALAIVRQVIQVDADDPKAAEEKVVSEKLWDDGIWRNCGLSEEDEHSPIVGFVWKANRYLG